MREPVGPAVALAIFEIVETSAVGRDIWLHALGLRAAVDEGLPGTDLASVPTLLGIPLPLWQQPLYLALGIVIAALALRLWTHEMRGPHHTSPLVHA
jgi:hypothetical protein